MINYIGQFKREENNTIIRSSIRKNRNIFTCLIFLPFIIYILFHFEYIKTPEKISGDRMATCKLIVKGDNFTGTGTAFLVSKNGLLLTARHCVVDDDDEVIDEITLNFDKVKEAGYDNLKASVVYLPNDKKDDFAILKLEKPVDIEPLKISSQIADPSLYNPDVKIIGYPAIVNTQSIDNKNSVINYDLQEDSTLFIIDEIFVGYSGGPVIDKNTGEVIGIVSWKIVESKNEFWNNYIGMSFCEKVHQVFEDPNASHINW